MRHPLSRGGEAVTIDVEWMRGAEGVLSLRYVARGDVRLPPEVAAERADGLWRTTCFEVFVRGKGDGYVEINLAPSTQWAAYRFSGFREGMEPADRVMPNVSLLRTPEAFELRAEVRLDEPAGPWRVGVSAVIEDTAGRLSYWALAHPVGRPDFHHPDSFVLELTPP